MADRRARRGGVRELVINTAHLAPQFPAALGDGRALGVRIAWSHEGTQAADALETLGGIVHALPLLADGSDSAAPFIVVSATSSAITTSARWLRRRRPSPAASAMRIWCWSTTRRSIRAATWAWPTD